MVWKGVLTDDNVYCGIGVGYDNPAVQNLQQVQAIKGKFLNVIKSIVDTTNNLLMNHFP